MSGTIHIVRNKDKNLITNTSFYSSPSIPKKHNHIFLVFDKFKLIYNDPRRFGFFKIFLSNKELSDYLKKYGPEPFEKKFNVKYLT